MLKPVDEWDEAYLLTLPIDENCEFDRKRSAALIEAANSPQRLSSYVSAFANSRGGYLVFGMDDEGNIDGGVPRTLKGNTTEWLESFVSQLVVPRLVGYSIRAISGNGPGSKI